jgi:transposase
MNGKELLVTITKDLKADVVVKRYKSLAESKGVFYVLKSEIEIGPIYHRPPSPMHAHASICFVALILYRVTRTLLQESERRAQSGRGQ